MQNILYTFCPAGTQCNPTYAVEMPPGDCTCLSEDDLYCLKYGEFIKRYSKLVCIPGQCSVYTVPEIHIKCNESLQIFRYLCIMMHFQVILYVLI